MYRASAKQTASRHPTKNVKQAGGITMEHATPASERILHIKEKRNNTYGHLSCRL